MTHFLLVREREPARRLGQPHAAVPVIVDLKENTCTIEPGLLVAGSDVEWVELPERFTVLSPYGDVIKRDKGLTRVVSLNTFDPCHLIADVREELWPTYGRRRR